MSKESGLSTQELPPCLVNTGAAGRFVGFCDGFDDESIDGIELGLSEYLRVGDEEGFGLFVGLDEGVVDDSLPGLFEGCVEGYSDVDVDVDVDGEALKPIVGKSDAFTVGEDVIEAKGCDVGALDFLDVGT